MDASGPAARLFAALGERPEKTALELPERAFTFRELADLSARFAAGLAALGVGPGDAVAVRMATGVEAVVSLLGNFRAGAVHVPLNPAFTPEETRHILTDSRARLTVAHGPAAPAGVREVAFGDVLAAGGTRAAGVAPPEIPDEAIALLLYTSGTTGRSKGVELSFRAVISNLAAVTALWGIAGRDRVVIALPLFHVHGLGLGVVGSFLHGATVVLLPKFEPAAVAEAFENRGATVFMGVPTMYVRLLEHLAREPGAGRALSRGRLFTSGSAPLAAADFAAFREATGHSVLERYGMTETFFTLSNPLDGERRPGSVGLPVPGCGIRIVDEQGRETKDGETGDLLVKSNGIMTRSRNRPEETAAAFRDGWFLTGDVATRSPDGYVTLHGRKSVDFVKSGGYRISAREVEEVLARHPSVREVAVVGLTDRVWGQRVAAAVLPSPGADAKAIPATLKEHAAASLAPYKQPREIVVVADFPRTPLGKIQKNALASLLERNR